MEQNPETQATETPISPPAEVKADTKPAADEVTAPVKDTASAGSMQYAGFGLRFVASLIDGVVLMLVGWVMTALGTDSFALNTLVGALYSILFWVNMNGQTPGKKIMNIKVVRVDGKPVDYLTSMLRYVGYFISAIPLLLGYIWVLFDEKKQGWHDKLANTYVIKV